MLRKIGLFGVIILLHFKSFAADNLSLIQNNNELTINYQIDNATDININKMLHSLLIKEKTTTHSPNGHFKVTIRIESKISKEFYDTLRLYSNGEFLLYRDYLLPEQITYQDNTKINIKDDRYPSISILENQEKQYIIGKRYIFFGKREKIKILGLDNNIAFKHKITVASH
ncbi:hypothetical protein RO21_05745 [[Actinobacillus] muris]|uniref:Uncharacterized protein n=1 Tax=Muribacter muris TaxID=67855 RepID=A0A0J5P5M0_9PAST|nr:hypothetical protein [Muribacter muris]KMK51566.1 hypothetical protein RO21_05745 [[Actinobacillus] muris] [Muribacter muris]